jgi:predicted Zn-ribbon and HTH transcriptional regulator
MGKKEDKLPPERGSSARTALREALLGAFRTARELSQRASLSEKEIAAHLEHLEKSLRSKGERLIVRPAKCLACEHEFEDRKRFSAPSRCPECKSERIAPPAFKIDG